MTEKPKKKCRKTKAKNLLALLSKIGIDEGILSQLSVEDLKTLRLTSKKSQNIVDSFLHLKKNRLLKTRVLGPEIINVELAKNFRPRFMWNHAEDSISLWNNRLKKGKNGELVFLEGVLLHLNCISTRVRVEQDHLQKIGIDTCKSAKIRRTVDINEVQLTKDSCLALVVKIWKSQTILVYNKNGHFFGGRVLRGANGFACSDSFFVYISASFSSNLDLAVVAWNDPQLQVQQGGDQGGRKKRREKKIKQKLTHFKDNIFLLEVDERENGQRVLFNFDPMGNQRKVCSLPVFDEILAMTQRAVVVRDVIGFGRPVFLHKNPLICKGDKPLKFVDSKLLSEDFVEDHIHAFIAVDLEDKDRFGVLLVDRTITYLEELKNHEVMKKSVINLPEVLWRLLYVVENRHARSTKTFFTLKGNFFIAPGTILNLEDEEDVIQETDWDIPDYDNHYECCPLQDGGFRMWIWDDHESTLIVKTWTV